MSKIANPEYLNKASQLSEDEAERLLSRMIGKLPKRLFKEKMTQQEAIAIQLEIEEEQLQEWREKMNKLKDDDDKKDKKKN